MVTLKNQSQEIYNLNKEVLESKNRIQNHSTVTDFAKFLGISTLQPLINAI